MLIRIETSIFLVSSGDSNVLLQLPNTKSSLTLCLHEINFLDLGYMSSLALNPSEYSESCMSSLPTPAKSNLRY